MELNTKAAGEAGEASNRYFLFLYYFYYFIFIYLFDYFILSNVKRDPIRMDKMLTACPF